VDYQDAKVDTQNNTFLSRGSFKSVKNLLNKYKEQGVTALHLTGAFERDNQPYFNDHS
jgi:hypothetical protein